MDWSDFTYKHIKYFKNKISIDKSNLLLIEIKNETKRVKSFIYKNKLDIKFNQLKNTQLNICNDKIISYSQVGWVDSKNLNNELINLENIFEFSWKTPNIDNINKIYIKTTNINIKSISKRIKYLIYIGEYLKYKSNNTVKIFDIYIILSNLKRYFPKKNKKVRVTHINGGYTDSNKNIIFVWRYEEFEKVFLHEIIHFLNMDSKHENNYVDLNINGPTSFSEAKTDFLAVFYHLIFLTIITKISIKKLLEFEFAFIENQAMALNNHFNLGSWKYKIDKSININQGTPAFSYYILKYLLFMYFMEHDLIEIEEYNKIINKIIAIGFVQKSYIKLKSSRMCLLQLD